MKGFFISTKTPGNRDMPADIGRLFGRPIDADKLRRIFITLGPGQF